MYRYYACMALVALGCSANQQIENVPPDDAAGGSAGSPDAGGTAGAPAEPLVCDLPRADCDLDEASGCEVDLQSDWDHCGACGHSCLGGSCVEGVCEPHLIGSMEGALPFAVDDDHLYTCSTLGSPPMAGFPIDLTRLDKSGHDPTVVVTLGDLGAAIFCVAIEVDDTHVFVADNNAQMFAMAKADPSDVTVFPPLGYFLSFAAHGSHIYFVDDSGLQRAPKNGSAGPELLAASTDCSASSTVVSGEHAYWTCSGEDGRVERAPLVGGSVEVLASGLTSPFGIAVTDSNAYYSVYGVAAEGTPGEVQRVALSGSSAPDVIASGQLHAAGITVLDDRLYWLESRGVVWQAELDGSDVSPRYDLSDDPCPGPVCLEPSFLFLRHDRDALYWNDLRGTGFRTGVFRRLTP